ncbi:MAG: DUF885 domain-containing protein [Lachnospiraceae bacterium]
MSKEFLLKAFLSKKRHLVILGLILLLCFGISVFCLRYPFSQDARFQRFTDRIALEEFSSNTLNLHYTLAYPQDYGIKDYTISLGTMEPDVLKQSGKQLAALQKKLEDFSYENLSSENRMIYDMLRLDFSLQLSAADFYLLQEPLGPNLGIQAQLPALLAEYTFRVPQDIQDYFSLLTCIPEYFNSILEFEKEKSAQGLFMNDTCAKGIIQQCTAFSSQKEENFLDVMFEEQLADLKQQKVITQKQADSYKSMHKKLLKKCVFPAYENLAEGLEKLCGTGKNWGGLCHLPDGAQYYEYLLKNNVGDFRPIPEIQQRLMEQLKADTMAIQNLLQQDPSLFSKAAKLTQSTTYSPQEMLAYLNQTMTRDFPSLKAPDYEVKAVPKAMEDFSSPAFYLTPPLDTLSPNAIYINGASQVSEAELFTTLAHEGFPGHLYQTLYFGRQQPSLIREFLGCSGYVEGWATYVESMAYGYGAEFLNISPQVMELLNRNRSISLCLYSILDIGIHYQGWTLQEVTNTLSSFGIASQEICQEIFQYIVENPTNYLKYYLGFLNFTDLRTTVENKKGTDFQLKDFHQKILEIGPAPFPVVKKYLLFQYETP